MPPSPVLSMNRVIYVGKNGTDSSTNDKNNRKEKELAKVNKTFEQAVKTK
jgi:hypothetical protein